MTDYAQSAQIGVLVPQANTTVEPELWALVPPRTSVLTARLTSAADTIEARLTDYADRYAASCDQFANAPVTAIAAACTGASYLIGAEAEDALSAQITATRGVAFLTAAQATVAALRAMKARRIALLSPYPDNLNAASKRYWEARGFTVCATAGPTLQETAFHPIYAMTGDAVGAAYGRLSESDADVVVMLGTGMPTLRPMLRGITQGLKPAISCNLVMVWAAVQGRRWEDLQQSDLDAWLAATHWRTRFDAMHPDAP